MEDERLEFLLNRYFDQALSAEEKRELESFLLESSSARATFWELARWHGAIRQWGQEEWGRRDALEQLAKTQPAAAPPQFRVLLPVAPGKPARQAAPHVYRTAWWLAAAAALVLGVFGLTKWRSSNPAQADNSGIAVLTHASSAVWTDETFPHENGEALRPGWLKLKSGALQVEFSRGARVVLEGPAEFELLSDNAGALRHGKLFATVPETAHGFSVRASSFSVVDYGTQFGCVVPLVGPPEVHVFRGAVGLETAARVKEELRANQAVRLAGAGLQEIPANLDAFITEEKLVRLESDNARVRLAAWRQSSPAFSRHPGMLVHFDFEKDGNADGTLVNRAPNAPAETNAVITGCNWTEGRWPGKSALEFQGSRDRARLTLGGEYKQMTFLAWVRADHLPFGQNSLVKAASEEKLGEAGWYIFRDGALGWTARIGPRGAAEQWRHVNSAPVFRADALGSWRMVATVFDGSMVTHYFDGKVVGSDPVILETPLHLGRFDVGNWSGSVDPDPALPERVVREMVGNFFGSIDELAILSVPLSAEEIRRLYEEGRPVAE